MSVGLRITCSNIHYFKYIQMSSFLGTQNQKFADSAGVSYFFLLQEKWLRNRGSYEYEMVNS